jgi:hypothetical protein
MKIFYVFLVSCLLVSCTITSESVIQTAITQTQTAIPAYTPQPTQDKYCNIDSVNQYARLASISFQEFIDRVILFESLIKKSDLDVLISKLQDLKNRIFYTEFPLCLNSPRKIMLDFMNFAIDYYFKLLSGVSTETLQLDLFKHASFRRVNPILGLREYSQLEKTLFDQEIQRIVKFYAK